MVVRFPAGRTLFHIGEEIPVELEFRGAADKDYYFSTGQCGYFTRLFWREEQVRVTPSDGVTDPFGEYFMSGGTVHAARDVPGGRLVDPAGEVLEAARAGSDVRANRFHDRAG